MASSEGVKYTCPQHAKQLLRNLQELRQNETLCDFTLVIDGRDIPVQRNMLAAGSPYFRSLFNYDATPNVNTTKSLKVNLAELNVATFEEILNYIYTSEITLNDDNIQNIFQAADVLLMSDLKQLCTEYLEQCINPANCLGIMNFTEQYCCPRIHFLATQCMQNQFTAVYLHEEFLLQPFENVREVLSSDKLQTDPRGEEVIFEAALRWLQYDIEGRKAHAEKLIKCIHFCHISPDFFSQHIEKCTFIANDKKLKGLVNRLFHATPCSPNEVSNRGYFDVIVVAGGQDSQDTCILPTVRCLLPQRSQWVDMPPMLTPRMQHALVSAGGCLYAVGGLNEDGHVLNTGEKYDPDTNNWTAIAPMIHGRYVHGLVAIDNYIYAIGGYEEDVIHTMEAYDIYTNTWETMPSMQISRKMAACVALQKKIYVIGGCLKLKLFDTVECFDTVTRTWSLSCPIMEQRFCAAAVGVDNKVFLFGGLRNLRCPSAQHQMKFCGTEIYDSKVNAWTGHYEAIPSRGMCTMTTSSRLLGAVHIDGYIYVIGGLDTGMNYQCIRCCHDNDLSPWYCVMEQFPSNQRSMTCAKLRLSRSLYYRLARKTKQQ